MSFEKLEKIVEIQATYETLSSLAIGAGDQPQSTTESPVIRVGNEPVLPGSSLKGALRSTLEAILAANGVSVCVPHAAIPSDYRRDRTKEDRQRKQQYLDGIGRQPPCDPGGEVCPVCDLFGTVGGRSGLSGRVMVLDARLTEEYDPAILMERTHVAITRDTRSQSGGALLTLEAVDAGVEFQNTIRIINPEDWHMGAILRALEGMEMLGIGAKKTAGYGQLKIAPPVIIVKTLEAGGWQAAAVPVDQYLQAFDERFLAR